MSGTPDQLVVLGDRCRGIMLRCRRWRVEAVLATFSRAVRRLIPSSPTTRGDADIERYRADRATPHRDSICNAPLTNLYLQANGRAAPCWLYFPDRPPFWGADRSLLDIWNGAELNTVRAALAEDRFVAGCAECERNIRTGNHPLAAAYDNDRPIGSWPTMLELELSNLCNLECVMCNGLLSSRIRKHREGLPPLEVPYDESFVDQLEEFLPHLYELRINGGEPLAQPLVHSVCERVAAVRPDLRVTIATNGTILNSKVRRLLDRCTIHLNISIDSLVPDRYESIRVRADFDQLMENFQFFHDYCRERDRTLCVMVNPMRQNWREMPDFVRWCNERDLPLWFNTIREPEGLALHSLPRSDLVDIAETWRAESFASPSTSTEVRNAGIFEQLVHQVETWRDEPRPASNATPVSFRSRK